MSEDTPTYAATVGIEMQGLLPRCKSLFSMHATVNGALEQHNINGTPRLCFIEYGQPAIPCTAIICGIFGPIWFAYTGCLVRSWGRMPIKSVSGGPQE